MQDCARLSSGTGRSGDAEGEDTVRAPIWRHLWLLVAGCAVCGGCTANSGGQPHAAGGPVVREERQVLGLGVPPRCLPEALTAPKRPAYTTDRPVKFYRAVGSWKEPNGARAGKRIGRP